MVSVLFVVRLFEGEDQKGRGGEGEREGGEGGLTYYIFLRGGEEVVTNFIFPGIPYLLERGGRRVACFIFLREEGIGKHTLSP